MANLQKTDQELQKQFNEILVAIDGTKSRVYSNINKELISLYWNMGLTAKTGEKFHENHS